MMRRAFALILSLLAVSAGPGRAAFHLAHIAEINTNAGGDPTDQYVEIDMEFNGQTLTANSVLSAWDCAGTFLGDLLIVPGNITTGGGDVRWIMATKNPVGGIAPDFVIPTTAMPATCGQVCWGAPGIVPPADPNSWSRSDLTNFVDCVAYGPYTGPTRPGSGAPSPLSPGDGTYALVRVDDTTLAAACPSPENNAGATGDYGPCTAPTTSTTTVSTTTSTTLPAGTADLLPGRKLLLKVKEGKPERSSVLLFSDKTADTTLGQGEGTADDPTIHGGQVLVASSPGGGFVDVYPLAAADWRARRKNGAVTGWGFEDPDGPITSVSIKGGKSVAVKGKGAALGHDLDDDPNPVAVVLAIGQHRYCLAFGGTPRFKANKKYLAKKAPAPVACAEFPD